MFFNNKAARNPEILYKKRVKFLYEQTGVAENALKAALSKAFNNDGRITSAHLVRLVYDDRSQYNVALCLFISDIKRKAEIEELAASIFTKKFNARECLDIIFPDERQARELSEVCEPFYINMEKNRESHLSDSY